MNAATVHEAGRQVLSGITLSLRPRMRLAIAGSAGPARDLILPLLAGHVTPGAGTVRAMPGIRITLSAGKDDRPLGELLESGLQESRRLERRLRELEEELDLPGRMEEYAAVTEAFERGGGYGAEAEMKRLLAGLGVAGVRGPGSAGQRRRAALAAALVSRPDVLLLEDPDTALDPDAQELLATALKRYPGAVAFTSHNRSFIDMAATHTGRLSGTSLTVTKGGWPARSGRGMHVAGGSRRLLLEVLPQTVRADGVPLFRTGHLRIDSGDRVVLIGPNGSGKSTFLDQLSRDAYHGTDQARFRWHGRVRSRLLDSRFRGLAPGTELREQLLRLASPQRIDQLAGLIGLPHEALREEPAELTQAGLARAGAILATVEESDLLMLDEPDAHLDVHALELLEDALLQRQGATVLVTHDRTLAANFATRVWEIQDGRLHDYRGGMSGYSAGSLRREAPPASAPVTVAEAVHDVQAELEAELQRLDLLLGSGTEIGTNRTERFRNRRRKVADELGELIDRSFPPPLPRFSVKERGIRLEADLTDDRKNLEFFPPAGTSINVRVQDGVAHLQAAGEHGSLLLPWARLALLNAATRLCFYALPVTAVQVFDHRPPRGLLARPAGGGWNAILRSRFEQLEGWTA